MKRMQARNNREEAKELSAFNLGLIIGAEMIDYWWYAFSGLLFFHEQQSSSESVAENYKHSINYSSVVGKL